jgi:hypothetical protein
MNSHPFDVLTPDTIIDAVESAGYISDARLLALNSYENRVYQVGIEDAEPLIAKFYRPGRWSEAQLREEHAFSARTAEAELPVVAPLIRDGETVHRHGELSLCAVPPPRRPRAGFRQYGQPAGAGSHPRPHARDRRGAAFPASPGHRCAKASSREPRLLPHNFIPDDLCDALSEPARGPGAATAAVFSTRSPVQRLYPGTRRLSRRQHPLAR